MGRDDDLHAVGYKLSSSNKATRYEQSIVVLERSSEKQYKSFILRVKR